MSDRGTEAAVDTLISGDAYMFPPFRDGTRQVPVEEEEEEEHRRSEYSDDFISGDLPLDVSEEEHMQEDGALPRPVPPRSADRRDATHVPGNAATASGGTVTTVGADGVATRIPLPVGFDRSGPTVSSSCSSRVALFDAMVRFQRTRWSAGIRASLLMLQYRIHPPHQSRQPIGEARDRRQPPPVDRRKKRRKIKMDDAEPVLKNLIQNGASNPQGSEGKLIVKADARGQAQSRDMFRRYDMGKVDFGSDPTYYTASCLRFGSERIRDYMMVRLATHPVDTLAALDDLDKPAVFAVDAISKETHTLLEEYAKRHRMYLRETGAPLQILSIEEPGQILSFPALEANGHYRDIMDRIEQHGQIAELTCTVSGIGGVVVNVGIPPKDVVSAVDVIENTVWAAYMRKYKIAPYNAPSRRNFQETIRSLSEYTDLIFEYLRHNRGVSRRTKSQISIGNVAIYEAKCRLIIATHELL